MAHKNRSNWSPYKDRNKSSHKADGPGKSTGTRDGHTGTSGKASPTKSGAAKSGIAKPGAAKTAAGKVHSQDGQRHRKPQETYSFNEADDRIYDIFRNHEFGDYPHEKRQQLTRFYELLSQNQHEQNFTRLTTLRDIAIKHFIDSLIVTRLVDLKFPLLDMGTGPGFPGIPLKVHFFEDKIVLGEGVQRRVEFLKHVREQLKLENLPIIGRNINLEFFYPVQGVITRAVEDARNTLGNVVNCLQTGGSVYLMKGPNCGPEIEMALEAWGEYFKLTDDISYSLPKTPHERRLLVFEKLKPHPLPNFEELDLAWEREFGESE